MAAVAAAKAAATAAAADASVCCSESVRSAEVKFTLHSGVILGGLLRTLHVANARR